MADIRHPIPGSARAERAGACTGTADDRAAAGRRPPQAPAAAVVPAADGDRRRVLRVFSLLALDFAGIYAALFTALMVKAVLRDGNWAWHASSVETRETLAFAYADHRAAVRPLEHVRRPRRAPGPAADRLQPVPGHAGGADLRARQRRELLELLHLLRHARVRDLLHRLAALPLRARHRRAAAGGRLPAPRGAGRLGQAHRGRRPRARRRGARAGGDGRLHLAHAAARQRPALARADRPAAARCWTRTACRR